MKRIILNADDFCLSPVFNTVILELCKEGFLSSTTVMVDRYTPEQAEQLTVLKNLENIGIGLHVEFTSTEDFLGQITHQYETFVELLGKEPSHLDMHKHEYKEEGYPVLMQFCSDKNLPHRNSGIDFANSHTTTHRAISGIKNSLDIIIKQIENAETNDSLEIILHPGVYDKDSLSSLNYEREIDITKAKILTQYCKDKNIEIVSFKEL